MYKTKVCIVPNLAKITHLVQKLHSIHCVVLHSRCQIIFWIHSGRIYTGQKKFMRAPPVKNIRYVWKVSGQSGNFPELKSKHCIRLESFRTVWKVSGLSGKFSDCLESFRTVWKVFGQSGKFLDSLESFWTVWKVSGQSGKFLDLGKIPKKYSFF